MTKTEKLLKKFQEGSNDLRPREMIKILELLGYEHTQGEWSHRVYSKPGVAKHITLAIHNNQIKPEYFNRYRKLLFPGSK